MKKEYSVSEAARVAHMTSETLRHYDRIGLVRPSRRDENTQYRYYTEEDIVRLCTVHTLQQMDLPLKKIHYAMAQNHFVKVVTDDGECRAAANFAQVQEQLMTQPDFLVCNRGVIINMSKVLRFDGECIEMLDGARLPVRQKDKKSLLAQFTQYQFRNMQRQM